MDDHPHLHPDSPLMTMSNSFLGDGMLQLSQLSIPGASRDPTYYISDGNSVLLVENTLFKVHRSILTKDRSAFETMFQLSTEADSSRSDSSMTTVPEGETDENPIRLPGDTADEFRALLWALYAMPHELMTAMTSEANCTQLLNLARITHKYQFRSIETWTLSALSKYYSQPGALDDIPPVNAPTGLLQPPLTDGPSLVQLTELAALCERPDLLDIATSRWKRLIGEGKDLALAIDIGERFNLRSMLGLAYHAMMLKGKAHWDADPMLTREQKIRLFCGYYALGKFWDALPAVAPIISHSAQCTSQQRCAKAWGALWKAVLEMGTQVIPTLQREDVLAKLMLTESSMKALVDKEIQSQGILDGLPHCKERALIATTMKVREFKETLADYFSDEF
ncbi:hypothetical protein CERSUDRAFT_112062 [Gelatoporia subvermispora B]|uniref:BTB domain-containing protein n=1 Tax=Ceriporiopsis subvermispora (strain B) TaxID=914234 RepID=M2R5D0_CERS8|nr:hypothetical protein CERSUDRAFT_112062 [Gelatoporia subvermispora B]